MQRLRFHPSVSERQRKRVFEEYRWKAKPLVIPAIVAIIGIPPPFILMSTSQPHSTSPESVLLAVVAVVSEMAGLAALFTFGMRRARNAILWDDLVRQVNPAESSPVVEAAGQVLSKWWSEVEREGKKAYERVQEFEDREWENVRLEDDLKKARLRKEMSGLKTSPRASVEEEKRHKRQKIKKRMEEVKSEGTAFVSQGASEEERRRRQNYVDDEINQLEQEWRKLL